MTGLRNVAARLGVAVVCGASALSALRAEDALVSRLIAAAAGAALMLLGGQLMIDDWAVPLAGAQLPSGLKFIGLCVGGALILVFAVERLLTGDYVPTQED